MNPTHSDAPRKRVLVVDDWDSFLKVTRIFLERNGYDVETRTHAAEAIELIARNSFDVLMLDLTMPAMDGFSTLEQLAAKPGANPNIKIIIVTSRNDPRDLQKARRLGAHEFLPKPYTQDELITTLRKVCS